MGRAGPGGAIAGCCPGGQASSLCPFASCSARGLEKARLQLQEEVRQLSSQLLEERKKREMHEALARRLQKRVLLLTKVRGACRRGPAFRASSSQPVPAVSTLSLLSRPPRLPGSLPSAVHPEPPVTCVLT